MASLRTQNALLFVIALCLVLLVVHLYSGRVVSKAQAQGGSETHLYGCVADGVGGCRWAPILVNQDGNILIDVVAPRGSNVIPGVPN